MELTPARPDQILITNTVNTVMQAAEGKMSRTVYAVKPVAQVQVGSS